MSDDTMENRLAAIRKRIEAACARCGRDPETVHLVAVSKTHPPESVTAAAAAGLTVMGENRVQEAAAKIPACPSHLKWHLVGHLQRNKAAIAVELFDLIHSVDSIRLLEALHVAADEAGRTLNVLLQVNVSGEASKFGLPPDEAESVLRRANELPRIVVRGLMTIPPLIEDVEKVRPHFRRLRELRDRLQDDTGTPLPELSMGMSHDFEAAIEEGAHWIRVGTALFGSRPKKELVENDGP